MNDERFTYLDMVAFDTARKKAGATRIPAWLCTSEEAKEEMRAAIVPLLTTAFGLLAPTRDVLEREIAHTPNMRNYLEKWTAMELELEAARKEGNPQAFFV